MRTPKKTGELKAQLSTQCAQYETELTTLAEAGDVNAQFYLGMNYLHGINGANKSALRAFKWLDMAVHQDHTDAMVTLARVYQSNEDEEHRSLAQAYYAKAARLGHADAQYLIGVQESHDCNYQQAIHWITLAAEQGHVEAQLDLAQAYDVGMWRQAQDKDKALFWYEQAAAQGSNQGILHAMEITQSS